MIDRSPAEATQFLFRKLNLVLDPWEIFVGHEPAEPEKIITIYDTSPIKDGRTMRDGVTHQHYGLQVKVRALHYPIGYAKVAEIVNALDKVLWVRVPTNYGEFVFRSFTRASGPVCLGPDETNNRFLFTLNVLADIHKMET